MIMKRYYLYDDKERLSLNSDKEDSKNIFGYIDMELDKDLYEVQTERLEKLYKENLENLLFDALRIVNKGKDTKYIISLYSETSSSVAIKDDKIIENIKEEDFDKYPIVINFIENKDKYIHWQSKFTIQLSNIFMRILDSYKYYDKTYKNIYKLALKSGYEFSIGKYFDEDSMDEPVFNFKFEKNNYVEVEYVVGTYKDLYRFVVNLEDICDYEDKYLDFKEIGKIADFITYGISLKYLPKVILYTVTPNLDIFIPGNYKDVYEKEYIIRKIYCDGLFIDHRDRRVYRRLEDAVNYIETERIFRIAKAKKTIEKFDNKPFTYATIYNIFKDYFDDEECEVKDIRDEVLENIKKHIK